MVVALAFSFQIASQEEHLHGSLHGSIHNAAPEDLDPLGKA